MVARQAFSSDETSSNPTRSSSSFILFSGIKLSNRSSAEMALPDFDKWTTDAEFLSSQYAQVSCLQ